MLACVLAGGYAALPLRAAPQEDTPRGRTHYKGREIARTMHYTAAPWLVRESREREEECSTLLRVLGIRPGQVVCDFGCGNGFYALKIGHLVGDEGKVLAVDIQKQMLALLERRAGKTKIGHRIETILGTVSDPRLPANGIDLVLMVDVYHELSHPVSTLRAIRESLRPGGRVVLVEFRAEDPKIPIKPLHKMSKRQILREIVPNGFRLVEQFDGLPWQHVMFFERAREGRLAAEVREGLERATEFARTSLAVRGGYAGIYSPDLRERHGESLRERLGSSEIWVQPPGTPSVGQAFLRAFRLTGEDRYFRAARDAGRALAWGQRQAGGWDHRADISHLISGSRWPARMPGHCTFDDNISQGALGFLIELDDVIEEPWLSESIELGLDHLLESQYENGAWPQWYPLRGGYHDYYTFNDNTINDCIRVALLAHGRYRRRRCLAAAIRGGEFIIESQGQKPQAGWAQQYSPDKRPAAARSFEPAAMCSAVTARNIRTLMRLHLSTGDTRFLAPIPGALQWLSESRLADGTWSRFYEIGTNRPIYGDRDGRVHYELGEISEERRKGYTWRGTWGIERLQRDYERVCALGAGGVAAAESLQQTSLRLSRGRSARGRAREILARLDRRGRWVRAGRIHIADLVRNMNALCDCLQLPRK